MFPKKTINNNHNMLTINAMCVSDVHSSLYLRKKNIFLMLFKSNYGINKPWHCCVYRIVVGTHFHISARIWWQPLMLSTLEHSQWCLQFTLLFIIELWYFVKSETLHSSVRFRNISMWYFWTNNSFDLIPSSLLLARINRYENE